MSLHTIIYVSSSTRRMSPPELKQLLQQAQEFNTANSITGMLLYRDGNFMQAIEGEESTVRLLYERIKLDKRHRGVIAVVDEPVEAREFGEWSMGFENIDTLPLGETQHSSITVKLFSQLHDAAGQTAGRSHRLLAGFFERAIR